MSNESTPATGDEVTNQKRPTAQEALAILLAGKPLKANEHTARYDEQAGITWYTNAYGVDGVLGGEPNLEAVTRFLEDMARGVDYGLTPK